MTDEISLEEYQKLTKRAKYGNRKVEADGYTFDSAAEYKHYCDLKLREKAGEIEDLAVHPKFVVIDRFMRDDGRYERATYYEADFSYTEVSDGLRYVIDVKGMKTAAFRLKWKLMQVRYPQFRMRLVEVKR